MMQSPIARQPLLIVGGLGLIAGVLVAYHLGSSGEASGPITAPAVVSSSAPAANSAAPAAAAGGIVFLDSRPADAATTTAATTPAATVAAPGTGGFLRMLLMMTFLVGGVIAWYLTRRRKLAGRAGGNTKALALVGTVRIAGRWQVALVKVPGKTLVLGSTDKGLTLLSELDDDVADEVAERDELAERVRDDDTISFGARKKAPDLAAPSAGRAPDLAAPSAGRAPGSASRAAEAHAPPLPSEGFGRLLEQLTRGSTTPPPPQRERMRTDEAVALRARLERHQSHPSIPAEPYGSGPKHTPPN